MKLTLIIKTGMPGVAILKKLQTHPIPIQPPAKT
jgi:hypothetical protein